MYQPIELFCFFVLCFILIYRSRKNSAKQKKSFRKKPKRVDIFEISKNLLDKVNNYTSQKTRIVFYIFKEKKDEEKPIYLYCDWIEDKIEIKYEGKMNKIEVDYKDQYISYNFESYHTIKLLFEKEKEITFNIHILLHNLNIFNLFIDNYDENTFSLEQMFYSKEITKFNRINRKTNDINNESLKCENYKDEYFMRCNLINITKAKIIDIISDYGTISDNSAKILTQGNPNLFLNILFGEEKKAKLHFFLNEEIHKYKLDEKDYSFFNSFYDEFIIKKFYEKFKVENVKYFERLFEILEEQYKIYENSQDYKNEQNDDSNINDYLNLLEDESEKNLKKYMHYVDKKFLLCLSDILSKKNNIKKEHLELCQKICLLSLCLIESPYESIKRFYELKDKFFKIDDISNYDKIKIMISIKTFLTFQKKNKYSFIEIVEYNKLTNKSPFKQGYLFYKEIIENLEQDSLLTFIFNQLNSGKGFDYISEKDCYKLKYIPLDIIKIHLLFNHYDNKYFFIYKKDSDEHAFTEGYSKDIFFNLSSLRLEPSDVYNSPNLSNDSTKIGLVLLHENCHIKFRKFKSFNMSSPRGVIQSNLNLFLNDYFTYETINNKILTIEKFGESGKALEFILFNDNNALSQIFNYPNIIKLKDYRLYIQDNNKKLLEIKSEIMKQKKYNSFSFKFNFSASSPNKSIEKINLKKNIYDSIILTDN